MVKKVAAALAISVLALPTLTQAQPVTGNLLNEWCDMKRGNEALCFGFMLGARDAALITSKEGAHFCIPEKVIGGQIEAIVKKYLANHPENLHLPGSLSVILALKEAFPCSNPN